MFSDNSHKHQSCRPALPSKHETPPPPNTGLLLDHRLRRWPNNKPALGGGEVSRGLLSLSTT